MSTSDAIDAAAHRRLLEWGGPKLLSQMIRLYLENEPVRMEQIRTGFASGAAEEVERGSHSLKSSAGNVGGVEVQRLCAEMEDRAARGDLSGAGELLPALEDARLAVVEGLRKALDGAADDADENGSEP